MMHGYKVDNDKYLLDYYETIDDIPDKIIYIEYDNNKRIASSVFDEFVQQNYYLYSEEPLDHTDDGMISVYKKVAN